jgi:sensor histidine kinase YesM
MKTRKNNIYFKKLNFFLFKFSLWVSFCFIFINFSFLRPSSLSNIFRELMVFIFIAIVVNFNTSYLYPTVSKKNNKLYILMFILSIFICTVFELFVFSEIFDTSYNTFLNNNKFIITISGNILLRNSALFIFFLWVEYFYRLILFLYEKEAIHQKEIVLLVEKQEFEKNFSRKKLLPHYFFNILELVQIKSSDKNYTNELINKVKFILYYFLVDAEQEKVEFDKELAFYNYYIELENLRHKEKISVRFDIIGQITDFLIIPLIYEPLIGNALKYSKIDGSGFVDIAIDTTHFPKITFFCKNNYSNSSSNIVSSESGLKILKQRLELCYKNKHDLIIIQSAEFYEVTLSITIA